MCIEICIHVFERVEAKKGRNSVRKCRYRQTVGESVLPRVLGPATAYVRTQGLQIDCCELKCVSFSPRVVANV